EYTFQQQVVRAENEHRRARAMLSDEYFEIQSELGRAIQVRSEVAEIGVLRQRVVDEAQQHGAEGEVLRRARHVLEVSIATWWQRSPCCITRFDNVVNSTKVIVFVSRVHDAARLAEERQRQADECRRETDECRRQERQECALAGAVQEEIQEMADREVLLRAELRRAQHDVGQLRRCVAELAESSATGDVCEGEIAALRAKSVKDEEAIEALKEDDAALEVAYDELERSYYEDEWEQEDHQEAAEADQQPATPRGPAASSAPAAGVSPTRQGEDRPPGLGTGLVNFELVALQEIVKGVATSVAGRTEATVANQGNHAELLKKLHDAALDSRKGLKADKPKLSASSAAVLHDELREFRLYMNDRKLSHMVRWFTWARAVATDRAKTCIESYIIIHFGNDAGYQRAVDSGDGASW
ncbi:unnamed protein product, partial [Prorocentrum cordatum]